MSHPSGSLLTLDRRSFLRLGALGAGALALGATPFALVGCAAGEGGAGARVPFNTKLGWIPDVAYSGLFIAKEDGLFEKAGLDVNIEPGGPNSPVVPLVSTGRLDVGIESIPENVAAAVNDGAKLRIVGAGLRKSPECWISRADNPIREPKDIEGKKLGSTLSGQNLMIEFMKRNGVAVDKVTLVPTQFDPAPLAVGEVDALLGFASNQPVVLGNQGVETVIMPTADYGLNRMQQVFFVTQETLDDEEKRERARQFLLATRAGTEKMLADHEAAAQLTVDLYGRDLGLNVEDQLKNLDALAPFVAGDETTDLFLMSDDLIAQTLDSLELIGVKADASLFTNELLES
ncbi:ABC transporter substrate-binding protein [Microbacterium sp.]|uniref:ABC transporter substrate-binding protein n=1 Tax=Microbacterium sp. TaxID=51671 RepID=UPI002811DA0C|nr:ABC transporter substrate-binding protein [Microbacterium sp.]